ncbi:MAG TPA: hypothetical protein VII06_32790 [Chloroflexota bacterium]|jgi:hypothetical protein
MRRCQLCQHLIDADFGDPHVCLRCIDARLDERFAPWTDDGDCGGPSGMPFTVRAAPR